MFLKSAVLAVLALVVLTEAAVIDLREEGANLETQSDYELVIGEAEFDSLPVAVLLRERRQAKDDKGSVSGDVSRGPGGTTTVTGEATRNIYTSPNGKTTVDAHGQYQRTYGNPHSKPNYNYGVGFKHRF